MDGCESGISESLTENTGDLIGRYHYVTMSAKRNLGFRIGV